MCWGLLVYHQASRLSGCSSAHGNHPAPLCAHTTCLDTLLMSSPLLLCHLCVRPNYIHPTPTLQQQQVLEAHCAWPGTSHRPALRLQPGATQQDWSQRPPAVFCGRINHRKDCQRRARYHPTLPLSSCRTHNTALCCGLVAAIHGNFSLVSTRRGFPHTQLVHAVSSPRCTTAWPDLCVL